MRIMVIGNMWMSYGEITDECNIRDALRQLGHEVVDYNWFDFDKIFADKPVVDFTLVAKGVTADQIRRLRDLTGAPVFYWQYDVLFESFPDTITGYAKDHFAATIEADGYFSKELRYAHDYRRIGAKYFYLPEDAASPSFERSAPQREPQYPVVFIGSCFDFGTVNRPQWLREIQEKTAPIPLHLFGRNPDGFDQRGLGNTHSAYFDSNLGGLIAQSKIVIALDFIHDCEGYWSNRVGKTLSCGGFVLCKFTLGMERAFGPDGENLVYWDTIDDCVAKIRYYLDHEDERSFIADRGYHYAKVYMSKEYRVRQFLTIARYKFGISDKESL